MRALSLEIDGIGGYTVVDINSWARPGRVVARDRELSGFSGRFFFANLGDTRVGIEVGRQQLFWYHLRSPDNTDQDTVDVESWYGGFAVRLPEAKRFSFDFTIGMYRMPRSILVIRDSGLRMTTGVAVYYRLVSYRGISLPIGARISSIVDERGVVLPAALTAGIAIRPFAATRKK